MVRKIEILGWDIVDHSRRGFAVGWDYAISWLTVLPFELTAAGFTIRFWRPDLNIGIWVAVFFVALVIIQVFGVRGYGEGRKHTSTVDNRGTDFCVS